MQSQPTTNGYILRIEAGEKIQPALTSFSKKNDINGASFHGLGACESAEIGMYNLKQQEYDFQLFDTQLEITNISGNIAVKNNERIVHAHVTVADENQRAFGGHLKEAVVNPTCEIHLFESERIERKYEDSSGLDMLDLNK